jgi:hypothetical protein
LEFGIEKGEILSRLIKRIHDFCLFLAVSHFLTASCFAGGWTLPEGNFYGRVAFNYYTADENFDNGGSRTDFSNNGDFSDANACLYMEYGLTPTLTLISNLTYKYLQYEDNAVDSETYGMGDMEFAARYALWRSSGSAFSVQGLIKVPEAYDETERVPLGNGQYEANSGSSSASPCILSSRDISISRPATGSEARNRRMRFAIWPSWGSILQKIAPGA